MTVSAKTINEINRLHRQVTEASQSSLQYSIEIGTMLLEVKKDVKHGDWEAWLTKNCPDISVRTASMYMRFAKPENAAKLEAAAEENSNGVADLTVRGAAKLLSKPGTRKGGTGKGTTTNAVVQPATQPASPDLKDLLHDIAPDELVVALHDAKWAKEQVQELIKILTASLKPASPPAVPGDLSIPLSLQRNPPPPAEGAKEDIARRQL